MTPRYRAWHKTWEEMGRITFIRYKKSGEIFHLSFRRNIYNGNIYGGLVKLDEIELMQSTGLVDKNGKEIFDGDIVRMRNPRDRRQIGMFQVVRVANSPMLGLLDKKLTTEIFNLYEHMRNYYEVKGNIYENPELLEN